MPSFCASKKVLADLKVCQNFLILAAFTNETGPGFPVGPLLDLLHWELQLGQGLRVGLAKLRPVTLRLKDGQKIRLDGTTGKIILIH